MVAGARHGTEGKALMTTIYELYGRQEERHVQEMEEAQAKYSALSTVLVSTIKRLKDGSLTVDELTITDEGFTIPAPKAETVPVEPAESATNGRGPRRAKARTT